MRKIMTGNEAVARGAYEAGVHVYAAYPGTPSSEIIENMAQYKEMYSQLSTNEKVATEVAIGANVAGARALTSMKHAGLNVAADPLFVMSYIGVNGGLVIISCDDPNQWSSGNEQDNRLYASHAKVAMIEPSDSQEAKDFMKTAYEVSTKFDIPVLYRMTTRICHCKGIVELGERVEVPIKEYHKDIEKTIMFPRQSRIRHKDLEENRLVALQEYSNHCELNRIEWGDKKIGIITNGIGYQHAKEVFGDKASFLKIGFSYPLPDKKIREFAAKVDKLYIVEENEPYIENFVKQLGIACVGKEVLPICGEFNTDIIRKALLDVWDRDEEVLGEVASTAQDITPKLYYVDEKAPSRPPAFCAGCPHRGIFYAISKYKDIRCINDIGCYGLSCMAPFNSSDCEFVMGSSFPAAVGFERVFRKEGRKEKIFAFVGDSTFFHTGINGLIDAIYNKASIVMCILDNSITAMTGHQENPGTGKTLMGESTKPIDIVQVVKGLGIEEENLRVVDPYDIKATEKAVKDAYESTGPFILVTKQPCALIKDIQKQRANMFCEVDDKKCKKCRICYKVGCPSISMREGNVVIDKTTCNGCTICAQVCPFDAIEKVGE